MNQSGFNGMSRWFSSWLFLHQQHHSLAAFPKKDAERAMEEMHEKRVLVKASECNDLHDETTMFFVSCFLFASWGFWQVFPKEVGLKQSPVFSPWDTWTSRAGSNSGTTCCPPKTWHATCATTATDPGRWPLQKVKQLEWVWMLPKSNCQHVGRHRVFFLNLLCDSDFFFFFFFKLPPWPKKKTCQPKKRRQKAAFGWWWWWCFFPVLFWDLSQVPITAGAPIIASGPVEPESLSKEAGGEISKLFFFGAALAGSTKRFLRFCVRCLEKNFCWCFLIGFFLCWFFSPNDPLFWLDKTLFWRVFFAPK